MSGEPAGPVVARGAASQAVGAADALPRIGRAATVALYDELALYPKPGLVSLVDCGSHADMDARTFMRSLFALRRYFVQIAVAGAHGAAFGELERLGVEAERRMLRVTGGVNTHRGAVFTLGLLCAAAGRLVGRGEALSPAAIRGSLGEAWGAALVERSARFGPSNGVSAMPRFASTGLAPAAPFAPSGVAAERRTLSNGEAAARRYRLRGANDEAACGFPVLFDVALPALRSALAAGLDTRHARLDSLLHVIAVLADTNLAHRGGLAGLRFAQRVSAAFIADGGASQPGASTRLEAIHHAFIARRLSPGGSADVLAAACWLQRVCA